MDRQRPIQTMHDIDQVLDSKKISFEEALDCARRAQELNDWPTVRRAAEVALDLVGNRSITHLKVEEAASLLAKSFLRSDSSLDGLGASLKDALDHMK